jgi:membrane protease YdiL (CAAX protease family)
MTINLIMIAVLPALGEEFIFRGVFQKIFCRLFGSGHIAIWITAFIFSFVHLQFFGFLPRFILGLLFGYLFYWSRTLWLPVIAHFVNNAVPTFIAYFQGWESYSKDSDIALWKQIIGIPVPIIACTLILLYFRNKSRKMTDAETDKIQPADV